MNATQALLWFEDVAEHSEDYLEFNHNEMVEASSVLEEHLARTRWIPVTERLPEDGRILVFWDNGIADIWNAFLLKESLKHKDKTPTFVTHWMPLPEAPALEQRKDV